MTTPSIQSTQATPARADRRLAAFAGGRRSALEILAAGPFAARPAVALSGDFVLHPDEIMQYLEPAHPLVFGSGVIYWEYFYGVRSWLVPGASLGY